MLHKWMICFMAAMLIAQSSFSLDFLGRLFTPKVDVFEFGSDDDDESSDGSGEETDNENEEEDKTDSESEAEDETINTVGEPSPEDGLSEDVAIAGERNQQGELESSSSASLTPGVVSSDPPVSCNIPEVISTIKCASRAGLNKPYIQHLLEINPNNNFWASLITLSYNEQLITVRDVSWSLEQFAKPRVIEADKANKLFTTLIQCKRTNAELLAMLKQIVVEKSVGAVVQVASMFKGGAASKNEMHNVFAESIELGSVVAFELMLEKFPEIANELSTTESVKRDEYVSKRSRYEEVKYSLIDWFMRDAGSENTYMYDASKKYAEAGVIITKRLIKNGQPIDAKTLAMIKILYDSNKIVEADYEAAYALRVQ